MNGFGAMPLGGSPFGLAEVDRGEGLGGAVLRDPATGESTGSRRIDPTKRDYVLDEHGRALGMHDIQQLVFLAVATAKGSSAMVSLGQTLSTIQVIDAGIERSVAGVLTEALAHLTGPRLISILGISVVRLRPGAIVTRLRWRDLTAQTNHTLET